VGRTSHPIVPALARRGFGPESRRRCPPSPRLEPLMEGTRIWATDKGNPGSSERPCAVRRRARLRERPRIPRALLPLYRRHCEAVHYQEVIVAFGRVHVVHLQASAPPEGIHRLRVCALCGATALFLAQSIMCCALHRMLYVASCTVCVAWSCPPAHVAFTTG
jgi:hypothetical protein